MKITTVLFDMDGTLLNTLDDLADSVNFTLTKFGCPTRDVDEIRGLLGYGAYYLIKHAMPENTPEDEVQTAFAFYKEYYKQNMQNKTAPYDGVNELLKGLHEKGIKMAVVSNKPGPATEILCEELFGEYIKTAIGVGGEVKEKPDPSGLEKALKLLNSTKEETVFVGDSDVDMQTAVNSNLKAIGVTWGFRDREIIESFNPYAIVDYPTEILDKI